MKLTADQHAALVAQDAKVFAAEIPYRPSNGTEGEGFIARWCAGCARDVRQDCTILARSLAFDLGDPSYPREWVQDGAGPRCTAFVPLGALSERAKKAWAARRAKRDAAFAGNLFGEGA